MSSTLPLAVVAAIDIPAAVHAHRFYVEALACAELFAREQDVHKQVIGTENTKQVELYGWAANVDSHSDNTGWVYILPLNAATTVCCSRSADFDEDDVIKVQARPGEVIRLNDHFTHWTEEPLRQATVAAFIGSFAEPDDARAIAALTAGVSELAAGSYYGAPRVREGFRILLPDECLAADDGLETLTPMLLADARRQGRLIERCGKCRRPAVRADDKWPYHTEMSRCRHHLGDRRRQTRVPDAAEA